MTTKIQLQPSESLWNRAWRAGPGWRGKREPLSPDEQEALKAEFAASGLEWPAFLETPLEWVSRRAKLFEVGDYPDKEVSMERSDLVALADAMKSPIPIWIEHAESPLALGFITDLWVEGHDLMGTTSLTREAFALIETSGAHSLSVGLSPDLSEIREVSLVSEPRIPDARIFRARPQEVAERVEALIGQGKLWPHQRDLAEAILGQSESLRFSGVTMTWGDAVERLLKAAPGHKLFRQIAPVADQEAEAALLLPEEADFYRRHFPGLDLNAIAAQRSRRT